MKIEKILLSKPGRKIVSSIVAFPFLRKLGMDSLDRIINQRLSEDREEWVPPLKVIEDQRHILHNMVKVVDRWASDKHVTKSSLDNFLNSFGPIFMHIMPKYSTARKAAQNSNGRSHTLNTPG